MAIYRCAVCGSSRVVPETRQEGYNKKHGIIGMALFGLGGAVAGASGNTVVYYHCADCGHTLNRCMSGVDKEFLEKYLLEPTNAAYIMRLRAYKKQYPNIEWEETTKEKNDSSKISMQDNNWSYPNEEHIKQLEERRQKEKADGRDYFSKYSNYALNTNVLEALYQIGEACTMSEMKENNEFLRKYTNQELSVPLRHLHNLKIIEKTIENHEIYYEAIPSSKEEAIKLLPELEKAEKLKNKIEVGELEGTKNFLSKSENQDIIRAVLKALYIANKRCTVTELQQIDCCKEYSNQQLNATLRRLVTYKIVGHIVESKKAYFQAIPISEEEAIKLLPE